LPCAERGFSWSMEGLGGPRYGEPARFFRSGALGALSGQETELFAIVWLKRGIVIETETSVLRSAAEAIAAAKLRAHDVARRHPGEEPDTFRLMDATGQILGVFPKKSPTTKDA
jgi:hypothetical protein